MSFSCRTQLPVMTLVPTYTFVGNLFQAFVMHALRWPPWFKTIWFGSGAADNLPCWLEADRASGPKGIELSR